MSAKPQASMVVDGRPLPSESAHSYAHPNVVGCNAILNSVQIQPLCLSQYRRMRLMSAPEIGRHFVPTHS